MVTRTSTVCLILSCLYLATCHPVHEDYVANLHAINNLNSVNKLEEPSYDANITIQEVENIIKNDPSLPRLTRGEIVDIIENITASDKKHREEKAVMLVMPYTANNSDIAKMQELYTKAPITKLIGVEPFVVKPSSTKKKVQLMHSIYKNDVPFTEKTTTTSTQVPFSPLPQTSSETSASVTHSKRRRRPTSTQTPRFSNHKYPEEQNTQYHEGLRIIDAPKLETQEQPRPVYTTHPTTSRSSLKNVPELPQTVGSISLPEPSYRPKPSVSSSPFSLPHHQNMPEFSTNKPAHLPDLPNELKAALNNLNLQNYNVDDIREENTFDNPEVSQEYSGGSNVEGAFPSMFQPQAITTTTLIPDISHVADTLTPDMKELLKTFGLLEKPNHKPNGFTEEPLGIGASSADITPDAYVKFKPLPESTAIHSEMEEFLGRFGLGRKSDPKRKQKAYQTIPDLPEDMKKMLLEMNLVNQGKKLPINNIFKPTIEPYATKEELDKLNQLLDIIKQLEKLNSTTEEELNKKININQIRDLVSSLNHNQLSPLDEQDLSLNPLSYDDGLSKNEVKRQENSTTTTPATITTSTEESRTPDVKDLEASFGGTVGVAEIMETIPPPTEAPKTGFYYLLDWNSFLDIDDQKGRRVNLRFQPKAGDPKRFLSVSVP